MAAKKHRSKVRNRILRGILLSACVMGIAVSALGLYGIVQVGTSSAQAEAVSVASAYAASVSEAMNTFRAELELVATDAQLFDEARPLEERKALLAQYAQQMEFMDLSVSDADGQTYSQTDISQRDYFLHAMQGETYISSPLIRQTDGQLTTMAATKCAMEGVDAALYGGIDYNIFCEMIKKVSFGESGCGYLIDGNGTIIAHTDDTLVRAFTNPEALYAAGDAAYKEQAEAFTAARANGSGTLAYINSTGANMLVGYTAVDGPEGWTMIVERPYAEVFTHFYSALNLLVALMLVLAVADVFVALGVANKIATPVKKVSGRLTDMESGDYDSPTPDIKTNDELEDLQGALCAVVDSMNDTMTDIHSGSVMVTSSSQQVAEAAQMLSQGAETQASSIEEISATLISVSETVKLNADNAQQAAAGTTQAATDVELGNEQMQKLIVAMEEIYQSASKVAGIIKAIEDIAFQTNILALNATIEASRAGEAGKGFAVVADEIRNLATKSSEAARNSSSLIDASITAAGNGEELAKEAEVTLLNIVEKTNAAAGLVSSIAESSEEQAASISEITAAITQISGVVTENMATAQESAASAQELFAQAETLSKLVGKFKLRGHFNAVSEEEKPVLPEIS